MVVGSSFINRIKERRRSSMFNNRSPHSSSGSNGMAIEHCGSFKILMLGDSGVGKTSICSRYVGDDTFGMIETENGDEIFESSVFLGGGKKEKAKQYELKITVTNSRQGPVEKYKSKIQESDGYILVYAKDNRQSYMKLIELFSDIHKLKREKLAVVVLGNKLDLNQNTLQVQEAESIVVGDSLHFDVSAQDNEGIQEAFKSLVERCVQRVGVQKRES